MIEVPSRGTSLLAIDAEPIHAGSEEDKGSKVPLLSRSHRTKGHAVITTEALPMEVIEGQTLEGSLYRYQMRLFPRVPFKVKG